MFTHNEIRQTTFEKVVRGYRPEDVESFLEQIADEYEAMEKEKQDLEEKLFLLAEKVEQYKTEEESIKTTLINAQRLGESIVADARQKSDLILREATIKKNDILAAAHAEIDGNEETLKRLKREVSEFKINILSLYKQHIESLSMLPEERIEAAKEESLENTQEFEVEEKLVQEQPEILEPAKAEQTIQFQENEDAAEFHNVSSLFDE